jgi:hypothetical protein
MEVLMKYIKVSQLTLLAALALSGPALATKRHHDDEQPNAKRLRAHDRCTDMLTLTSSDGFVLTVEKEIASLSETIKKMLETPDQAIVNSIPFDNMSGFILEKILECLHIINSENGDQTAMQTALSQLITQYNFSGQELANFQAAAQFLDIPQIIDATKTQAKEPFAGQSPFEKLPNELLIKIIGYAMNDENTLESIATLHRTSQTTRTIASSPEIGRLFLAKNHSFDELFALLRKTFLKSNFYCYRQAIFQKIITQALHDHQYPDLHQTLDDALEDNDIICFTRLLSNPVVNLHQQPEYYLALLDRALEHNLNNFIFLLLASGININPIGVMINPLGMAAYHGNSEIVQCLLAMGAQVDLVDQDGSTALQLAAARCHLEIAKLLIKHGAAINTQDKDGRTALSFVLNGRSLELILYLHELGGREGKPHKPNKSTCSIQ